MLHEAGNHLARLIRRLKKGTGFCRILLQLVAVSEYLPISCVMRACLSKCQIILYTGTAYTALRLFKLYSHLRL